MVAAICSVGGGSGALIFRGQYYRLSDDVCGGIIGAAKADLIGTASNLRTAADIVAKKSSRAPDISRARLLLCSYEELEAFQHLDYQLPLCPFD